MKTLISVIGAIALLLVSARLALWLARDNTGVAMLIWLVGMGLLAIVLTRQLGLRQTAESENPLVAGEVSKP